DDRAHAPVGGHACADLADAVVHGEGQRVVRGGPIEGDDAGGRRHRVVQLFLARLVHLGLVPAWAGPSPPPLAAPPKKSIAGRPHPGRCGTPATARLISTPASTPMIVRSLTSPRWPMRNTLPASLVRPVPSDTSKRSSAILRKASALCPSGISRAVNVA